MKRQKLVFPKKFLWGAATAAHQVEGGLHNQWTEWELQNAERLAKEFSQKYGWLPRYKALERQGINPANYISGDGIEHYQRYKDDIKLLRQLNLNTFRFSIEWSRIEPEEGKWDEQAIEHYRDVIAELKRQGIEPIPTLLHFTMPLWFTAKGEFKKKANIDYFVRLTEKITMEYGSDLEYLVTLNEPNTHAFIGYYTGDWPPQQKNIFVALKVYLHLVLAHRRAYAVIKRIYPKLQVGVAMSMAGAKPLPGTSVFGVLYAQVSRFLANRWFTDRIRRQQDFIGINYYFANYYHLYKPHTVAGPKNDLGWYMEPSNIEQVIVETWQQYRVPIIITENGLADELDEHRQWWLEETIAAMENALKKGVDLRGYLHWSLLDNFEWAFGWWPKFGLIAVDRTTMKRTIRPSAKWFANQIRTHTDA